jgi:hypothetical protein
VGIPYPRCGNELPHDPHPAHTADFAAPDCPGWTAGQRTVRRLITGVREYTHEHYAPGEPYPEGLRVEMHPDVCHLLLRDGDLWEGPSRKADVTDWLPVPVKITTDMKRGQWRLVIVTEEVRLDG